jgi:hypothetical protein
LSELIGHDPGTGATCTEVDAQEVETPVPGNMPRSMSGIRSFKVLRISLTNSLLKASRPLFSEAFFLPSFFGFFPSSAIILACKEKNSEVRSPPHFSQITHLLDSLQAEHRWQGWGKNLAFIDLRQDGHF